MTDENCRSVKEKGLEGDDNWRNGDGLQENTASGSSRSRATPSQPTNISESINISTDTCRFIFLELQFLNYTKKKNDEIFTFLVSNGTIYRQILHSDVFEERLMALIRLTAKACESHFVTTKSYMLKYTMKKKIVSTICSFLSGLVVNDKKDFWQNFGNLLDDLLFILENAMKVIPLASWEFTQTIVKTIILVLSVVQKDKNSPNHRFEARIASLKDDVLKIEKKSETILVENEDSVENEELEPEDYYRFINIYPYGQELIVPERPYIKKNVIEGGYQSVKQYLDIHFRLMREDFLNPIREDVCAYLNNTTRPLFNIKVHRNVTFLQMDIYKSIVCFQVKINISEGLQNIEQQKRFRHGTLLFFSDDHFKSNFCGKVVSTKKLSLHILLVELPTKDKINYTKTYSMIECIILFEPYYQVLNVLQRLPQDKLPMEKYILKVDTNTSYPSYMRDIRNLEFPPGLSHSQEAALNAALNKEFVMIQGPPGTGKTFLGMTLVKMLLKKKKRWEKNFGPILVISFTNHALEQFLGMSSKFTDKIVRIGKDSNDLRDAHSRYSPEQQLKDFLEEEYRLSPRCYHAAEFYDYPDELREYEMDEYYKFYRNNEFDRNNIEFDRDKEFDSNFKQFVKYLEDPDAAKPWYTIEEFREINRREIPLEIREGLEKQPEISAALKRLKSTENSINRLTGKIDKLSDEYKVYLSKKLVNIEFFPQRGELLCWLLCDDGTICPSETNGRDISKEDINMERQKINVLWSFIEEMLFSFSTIDIFDFDVVISHFSYNLKNGNMLPVDRKYFEEIFDFFLKKIDYLKLCLKTDFGPPEIEFENFSDPYMIQSRHRWQLYKYWIEIAKNNLRQSLEILCDSYRQTYETYNNLKENNNVKLLKNMDIVGMTTTSDVRLRSTLEELKCRIVIVEEASEVLESHIITALTENCQHLILFGDQQLRPTTSDHIIGKKYKLEISLLERMILNNIECHTLNVQHRMRPEIASLISPLFYKELYNHKSVENYPLVSGIGHSLYFIDHMEPEEPYGDSSKMNVHEASFLIELAIYLLNNNYSPKAITILATCSGQSYVLKKEQKKSSHPKLKQVKITVVDDFQGEENKIILLSLARSNSENKVGFLSIDNIVCVALSRAKVGLYIMGNMTLLCEATDVWKSIRDTLQSQGAIGKSLPLCCKSHNEHTTFVSKATDFANVPEGCNQVCNVPLNCGHNCVKTCHIYEINHEMYNCEEPCSRSLCGNANHKCKKLCFENCGPCDYLVDRKLPCGHEKTLSCSEFKRYKCMELIEIKPECGHVQNAPCFTNLETFKCMELVEIQPDCGHTQNIPCSTKSEIVKNQLETNSGNEDIQDDQKNTFKCNVLIEKTVPRCGHVQKVHCFEDIENFQCQFQLEITLKCGHKTDKLCCIEEKKIICPVVCDEILLCGHKCTRKCHINDDPNHHRNMCSEPCTRDLSGCNYPDNHRNMRQECWEADIPCLISVIKFFADCPHFEYVHCSSMKSQECKKPCLKILPCGHYCKNLCNEICSSSCQHVTFKTSPECGHKIKVNCGETPLQKDCREPCVKILECGHSCTKRCYEPCNEECLEHCLKILNCNHKCIKKCNEYCACKTVVSPHCGHRKSTKCGEEVSFENCKQLCEKTLDCGHTHVVPCNKPISEIICEENCKKTLACGHDVTRKCNESVADILCNKFCKKILECGHNVTRKCNESVADILCNEFCKKILECGHMCREGCRDRCSCRRTCTKTLDCGHRCSNRCNEPCLDTCLFPCIKELNCGHKCKNKCYEPCTEICLKRCEKKLACGHQCTNTCSEGCITVCAAKCGKELPCGHLCRELCGKPCAEICHGRCKKTLHCGHQCCKKCFEECATVCTSVCSKMLQCGHECQTLCGQPCGCRSLCRKRLQCGHPCEEKCKDPCTPLSQCTYRCTRTCAHTRCTKLCNESCLNCTRKCTKKLDCGHECINRCYEKCACNIVKSNDCIHYVRIKCGEVPTKVSCTQLCNKQLECGHACKQQCNQECKCLESCRTD